MYPSLGVACERIQNAKFNCRALSNPGRNLRIAISTKSDPNAAARLSTLVHKYRELAARARKKRASPTVDAIKQKSACGQKGHPDCFGYDPCHFTIF